MRLSNTLIYKYAKLLLKDRPYLSDRKQIELVYRQRFGKKINLDNPRNFNEKNNALLGIVKMFHDVISPEAA